jgi:hypothetical protein
MCGLLSLRLKHASAPRPTALGCSPVLKFSRIAIPFLLALAFIVNGTPAHALGEKQHVFFAPQPGAFPLVNADQPASICMDPKDWPGVLRVGANFAADVTAVTGRTPAIANAPCTTAKTVVVIGTISHSALIAKLIAEHRLDVSKIRGHWEMSVTQIVDHPFPGVDRALVIAGADKRGTIFGVYDLSEQIGVSPWAWWADVPVPHHDSLFVAPGTYIQAEPAVKYRGIFLNDEAPALSGWAYEKFGGFNHKFYEHVFDLLLRLKANFLWPAMWGSAFNEDDPLNPKLADEYGIVMGTSHHEPMMRAQQEWKRHGTGPWDYSTNSRELDDFWREGVRRNKNYEELTTIGMRGDGDMAMSASTNTALLEKIVADQRKILAEEVNPDVTKVPQVWALYKEVQQYYEAGMRVPSDVTLLWCDDNWGNLRRLPTVAERSRPGGAGIYYHFDYVGDPRSYKWINTNAISKVQEQMHLAWRYGADRVWIVNVGDLKPMEFPIEFFLDMARGPARWDADHLHEFTVDWATRDFGPAHAEDIARLMETYERYISRRKPELLAPDTFSFQDFDEANRVEGEWISLMGRSDGLMAALPADQRPAYFELLGYEIQAAGNDAELYIDAGRNAYFAKQGWADANRFSAEGHLRIDAELSARYNHQLNSKWDHMMDQTHIGYTFWNEPPKNVAPPTVHLDLPEHGGLGVSTQVGSAASPMLGTFVSANDDPAAENLFQPLHPFTLFNKGAAPVSFTVTTSAPWIQIVHHWGSKSPNGEPTTGGTIALDDVLAVRIDWQAAPHETTTGSVTIDSPGSADIVLPLRLIRLHLGASSTPAALESNSYVALNAAHTSSRTTDPHMQWQQLPSDAAALSPMTTVPALAASELRSTAALNYRVALYDTGDFTLHLTLAPTLNFVPGRGLRFAVSIDNGPRILVDALAHNTTADWSTTVSHDARQVEVPLTIAQPGLHTLHIYAVDPALVLERLVLAHGPLPYSYLGPPESSFSTPSAPSTPR